MIDSILGKELNEIHLGSIGKYGKLPHHSHSLESNLFLEIFQVDEALTLLIEQQVARIGETEQLKQLGERLQTAKDFAQQLYQQKTF